MEAGIGYLRQAVDIDPKYALAWATLGWAVSYQAQVGWTSSVEGRQRAREAVERALALEPDLAEGHARLGWIQFFDDWDWPRAEASLKRAIELDPGNADILRLCGLLAHAMGRDAEAEDFYRRALALDPINALVYSNLAWVHWNANRLDEAMAAYDKVLEFAPFLDGLRAKRGLLLLDQGRPDDALAEALREVDPLYHAWALAMIHHRLGHGSESDKALASLFAREKRTQVVEVAEVFAVRGEIDLAFEWLERAYSSRDSGIAQIKALRGLRSLHGDPRWAAFLARLRLAP
jgi:tetratricopeptide (TPR) repeat protein